MPSRARFWGEFSHPVIESDMWELRSYCMTEGMSLMEKAMELTGPLYRHHCFDKSVISRATTRVLAGCEPFSKTFCFPLPAIESILIITDRWAQSVTVLQQLLQGWQDQGGTLRETDRWTGKKKWVRNNEVRTKVLHRAPKLCSASNS